MMNSFLLTEEILKDILRQLLWNVSTLSYKHSGYSSMMSSTRKYAFMRYLISMLLNIFSSTNMFWQHYWRIEKGDLPPLYSRICFSCHYGILQNNNQSPEFFMQILWNFHDMVLLVCILKERRKNYSSASKQNPCHRATSCKSCNVRMLAKSYLRFHWNCKEPRV